MCEDRITPKVVLSPSKGSCVFSGVVFASCVHDCNYLIELNVV